LKFTIISEGDNSIVQPFLAANLFQKIYLETRSNVKGIQMWSNNYTYGRILQESHEKIQKLMTICAPSQTMTTGSTTVCYLPIYGFFQDHPSKYIDTMITEKLMLNFWSNSSFAEAGLSADLTEIKVKPIYTFYELQEHPYPSLELIPILSYDFDEEKRQELIVGATTTEVIIKTKRSVISMNIMIHKLLNQLSVHSFKLISNGKIIIEFDKQSVNNNLLYWFSMKKSRSDFTFLLNLFNLRPLTLQIEHDIVPDSGYYVYVMWEYLIINELDVRNSVWTRLENY
jgi:hypothetical protein